MSEQDPVVVGFTTQITKESTIHERMAAILAKLPAIGKGTWNKQQEFHYRSHDDVLNALNPLLAQYGVYIVPHVIERVVPDEPRRTRQGNALYEVNLHVEYTFVGLAGDWVKASAWGEGTDAGDKATNKAMTMAFKYCLAQVFAISTADTIDSDGQTPEETVHRERSSPITALERVIEEIKEHDLDPAHGGNYWYQTVINVAHRDYQKGIDDLSEVEVNDIKARFEDYLMRLKSPPRLGSQLEDPVSPGEAQQPLNLEETVTRQEGPTLSRPTSWVEVEQLVRGYGEDTWGHFQVFAAQARSHLFPNLQRLSADKKNLLLQKASGVVVNLIEAHDPSVFPPPNRVEFQAHWAKALDGAVLPGPPVKMSPDDVVPVAAAENGEPLTSKQEELDKEAAEAAARED